ncbi:MAG TPA: histidine kinase dimerization/phosphoacceptor domain-containing protein [Streptosporangiaceae bacterium]|nr:histidine kinase dimerization/phosphoacceptor domain-containing protein [Streptosporangiaceae bacterium]
MTQSDPLPVAVPMATARAAISPSDLARYPIEERDRIARRLNDVVIQRIFAAGLNLQMALGLVRDQRAVREISHAVDELDRAIRDIREGVFNPGPPMA